MLAITSLFQTSSSPHEKKINKYKALNGNPSTTVRLSPTTVYKWKEDSQYPIILIIVVKIRSQKLSFSNEKAKKRLRPQPYEPKHVFDD